jgi:hypothetical protein
MWTDEVLPRLAVRGVGADLDVRTLRLHGIGESQVAEILGDELLREPNPVVATYARHEAVDVRISARSTADRSAPDLADVAEATVLRALEPYVWARGGTTWAAALGEQLDARDWTLATTELGTGGALVTLLRGMRSMRRAEVHNDDLPAPDDAQAPQMMIAEAERVRATAGADVGFAVHAINRGNDTRVLIGVATPAGMHADERLAFQRGAQGADRAAIAGAAVLLATLKEQGEG